MKIDLDSHTSKKPQPPEDNAFLRSLSAITADQLGEAVQATPEDPAQKRYRISRTVLAVLSVLAFIAALLYFIYRINAYRTATDLYDALEQEFFSADALLSEPDHGSPLLSAMTSGKLTVVDTDITARDYSRETMLIQLQRLQAKNSDVFGWIQVKGDTGISYPLLDNGSNAFYLVHAYDRSYNPTGSIFLDAACYQDLDANNNTVIWGHNMLFGTPMFHNLLKYKNAGYWYSNRYVFIYTPNKTYRYEIYSAYQAEDTIRGVGFFTTDLDDWADKETFIRQSIEASTMDGFPEIAPTANDQILSLCTCDEDGAKRYVVHARRMADWELIDGKDNLEENGNG